MQLIFVVYLQGAIIIHEVYEEGAASKDGRLWAGDQILEVQWLILSQFIVICYLDIFYLSVGQSCIVYQCMLSL